VSANDVLSAAELNPAHAISYQPPFVMTAFSLHHHEDFRHGETGRTGHHKGRLVSVATPAVSDGRRRPERPKQVSPHLVPLLRDPAEPELSGPLLGTAEVMSFNEDLLIARGFGVAMLLAVPAWAGIGLIIWLVLR